jgi:hypothetical protein
MHPFARTDFERLRALSPLENILLADMRLTWLGLNWLDKNRLTALCSVSLNF